MPRTEPGTLGKDVAVEYLRLSEAAVLCDSGHSNNAACHLLNPRDKCKHEATYNFVVCDLRMETFDIQATSNKTASKHHHEISA